MCASVACPCCLLRLPTVLSLPQPARPWHRLLLLPRESNILLVLYSHNGWVGVWMGGRVCVGGLFYCYLKSKFTRYVPEQVHAPTQSSVTVEAEYERG